MIFSKQFIQKRELNKKEAEIEMYFCLRKCSFLKLDKIIKKQL